MFQLNLLSVVGYYGSEVAKTAEYLLQKGKYDFVGTDIHHKNHVKAFSNQINLKDSVALKETILKNQFFTF